MATITVDPDDTESLEEIIAEVIGDDVTDALAVELVTPTGGTTGRTIAAWLGDVVNVKAFGAVGNGIADDTAAIQAAVNAASDANAPIFFPTKGPYLISAKIVIKASPENLVEEDSGDGVHFSDTFAARVIGCHTVIKATASMTSMFELIFDTADSDIGPFYAHIEGIAFDGNSVATNAIFSNFTMHVSVEHCSFYNVGTGFRFHGYGVGRIRDNVFRCTTACIAMGNTDGSEYGGGDSLINGNDFYVAAIGIDCGLWSGNTEISANTFTRTGSDTTYGIRLSADYSSDASKEVRHIRILSNELCGMTYGIYSRKSTAGRNNYHHIIANNHVTQFSSFSNGRLIDANGTDNLTIVNNSCNLVGGTVADDYAIYLVGCQYGVISNNRIENYTVDGIRLQDVIHFDVMGNYLRNCGKGSSGNVMLNLINTTTFCNIRGNRFIQDSASYAQNGIFEQDTLPANNRASDNIFVLVATRQRANATGGSIFTETFQGSATFDPTSLADGAGETTTVTVTGARLGDFAMASFSLTTSGITITAWVSTNDTVSVRFQNESGGVLDIASGTIKARILK